MSEQIDLILALAAVVCETFVMPMVESTIAVDVTIFVTNVAFVLIF